MDEEHFKDCVINMARRVAKFVFPANQTMKTTSFIQAVVADAIENPEFYLIE